MGNIKKPVHQFKELNTLPLNRLPDTIYYVLKNDSGTIEAYITDKNSNPFLLFDTGIILNGVASVTGTGVTGTPINPKVNIATFVSNQLGNQVQLSTIDGKLQVNPITSPDSSLEITSTDTELQIELSSLIASIINSALQSGDNISELFNDVGYAVALDLGDVAFSNDYEDLDNKPSSFPPSPHTHPVTDISGTKSQFNTSLTDGDFLYVGDITQYTDELAQDAIGNILTGTNTIDLSYNDSLNTISAIVKPNSITANELANTIPISEFVNDSSYETTSQLNVRDTNNRNRSNHTGTQLAYTISDFTTASRTASVADVITDGITTIAPSQNSVYDALILKENKSEKGISNGYASLDSGGKVPSSQLPNSVMELQGEWNALTNTPTLIDGIGNAGNVWKVTTAGTQNLGSGNIDFGINDFAIYGSTGVWFKSDNTDAVNSVFGRVGTILAQSGDYTASQVINIPSGNISSISVQNALNELDLDKLNRNGIDTFSGQLTIDSGITDDSGLTLKRITYSATSQSFIDNASGVYRDIIYSNGELYALDYNLIIRKITLQGVISNVATDIVSNAYTPTDFIRTQTGEFYFTGYASGNFSIIRKIDSVGTITTLTTSNTMTMSGICQVGINGDLYVSTNNHGIKRVNISNGIISDITTSGATLTSIVYATDGNLYVLERDTAKIKKVTLAGVVNDFATIINAGANLVDFIQGADGNFYVTDSSGYILLITASGVVSTFASNLLTPSTICQDSNGILYVVEYTSNSIKKLSQPIQKYYTPTVNGKVIAKQIQAGDVAGGTTQVIVDTKIDKASLNNNFSTPDGTGTKVATYDATESLMLDTMKVFSRTGLADTDDETFYAASLTSTILRISAIKRIIFTSNLYTSPFNIPDVIKSNIPQVDFTLASLGLPDVTGTYIRFFGYNKNAVIQISATPFLGVPTVCQLGYIKFSRTAPGVWSFAAEGVVNFPEIAGYSRLERDTTKLVSSTSITPKVSGQFTLNTGQLVGFSAGWTDAVTTQLSPNIKSISAQPTAIFRVYNPITFNASSLPSTIDVINSNIAFNRTTQLPYTVAQNNAIVYKVIMNRSGELIFLQPESETTVGSISGDGVFTAGSQAVAFQNAKDGVLTVNYNTAYLHPDTYTTLGFWVITTTTSGIPNLMDATQCVFLPQSSSGSVTSTATSGDLRVPINDTNFTITGSNNQLIAYTNITANRTLTLPSANIVNQRIWIVDESNMASSTRMIVVAPGVGDTIGGGLNTVINFPGGTGYLESNGLGKWTIISTTAIQLSAGVISAPSLVDNGNGTITVGSGVYSLFANIDGSGRPKAFAVVGGLFTFSDNNTNYIYAEYDTTIGTASLKITTSDTLINDTTQVNVISGYRQGLTLFLRNYGALGLSLANKTNRSLYKTQRIRTEPGSLLLGETTGRVITITSGTAWIASAETPLIAINSSTNTCYHVIQTAPSVWSTTTVVTQYNNTQFNTTAGLQTLSNNRYAVNFVYRRVGTSNAMAIVLGTGDYILGDAQTAIPPTNLPPFISQMYLVGRIIVQKTAVTATQIDNSNAISFSQAGVTDHNALSNLQLANTGVTFGHITDQTQTIFGDKTFGNNLTISGLIQNYLPKAGVGGLLGNSNISDSGSAIILGVTGASNTTQINGLTTIKGTVASDTTPLGAELLTSDTPATNWSGTSWATGYTHTVGSVVPMTSGTTIPSNTNCLISITITGRTAGNVSISLGGYSGPPLVVATIAGLFTTSASSLTVTPSATFDGTVSISLKTVGISQALLKLQQSSSLSLTEIRQQGLSHYFGKGSGALQTSFGDEQSGFGSGALGNLVYGHSNAAFGLSSMNRLVQSDFNAGFGSRTLEYLNGAIKSDLNVALGQSAGRLTSGGSNLLTSNTSVFIGANSSPAGDNELNQIVIGYLGKGLGSNTSKLGSTSITQTHLHGTLTVGNTSTAKSGLANNIDSNDTASTLSNTYIDKTATVNNINGGALRIGGTMTASSGGAKTISSTYIAPSLVAGNNNDILIGLDINPTFTIGAFTGVNPYGLRVNGYSVFQRYNVPSQSIDIDSENQNITAYSSINSAKILKFASTTDRSNTLPIAGVNGMTFYVRNNLAMSIYDSSNIGINGFTDYGAKFEVVGTSRFSGRVLLNASGVNYSTQDDGINRLQIAGSAISTAWKTVGGLTTQFVDGTGTLQNTSIFQLALTNPITGSLTSGYLPKAIGSTNLGNSSIYDNGNIGIGTTTPTFPLSVSSNTNNASIVISRTDGVAADWHLHSGRLGGGEFSIGDNNDYRFIIRSSGNVLIGTTTDNGSKLQVNGGFNGSYFSGGDTGAESTILQLADYNGVIKFRMNGEGNTFFTNNVTAAAYFTSSDIRLKNTFEDSYTQVYEIKAISYTWKDESKGTQKQIGYSAQEVQKILPDAVSTNEEGFLTVNYIQVLIAKVEVLENRIKELEFKLNL